MSCDCWEFHTCVSYRGGVPVYNSWIMDDYHDSLSVRDRLILLKRQLQLHLIKRFGRINSLK